MDCRVRNFINLLSRILNRILNSSARNLSIGKGVTRWVPHLRDRFCVQALLNEYTLILVLMFIFRSIIMAILAGVTVVAIPIRHGPEAEVLADVGACVNDPTAARTMQYGAQLRASLAAGWPYCVCSRSRCTVWMSAAKDGGVCRMPIRAA